MKEYKQLFNIVCPYNHTHKEEGFMDFRIYNKDGKDITKKYYGQKPDVDNMDTKYISHSLCDSCKPIVYKEAGIEEML